MIDLRTHIYSLAAVFLALALGIVIGTSFSRLAPSSKSERKTIQRYAQSMRMSKDLIEKVGRDINRNKRTIQEMDDMIAGIIPMIIRGKLAGRNVAIVQTGDYDQLVSSTRKCLEEAGATVTSVTEISRSFNFSDDESVANALTQCGIAPSESQQTHTDRFLQVVSSAMSEGRPAALLAALENHGLAKFRGDYTKPNKLIVIVGGSESEESDTSDTVDTAIVKHLDKPGVIVVGCETSDCSMSYVETWHRIGIASIDNVDWASGKLSLIYGLLGDKARFGIKDSADQALPKELETISQ